MINIHYKLAPFTDRLNLIPFLNDQGLTDLFVEVGLHRGDYAAHNLNLWNGKYVAVDHYPSDYHEFDPAALGDREEDKAEALRKCSKHPNFTHINKSWADALVDLSAETVDCFYLDGNHSYLDVFSCLLACWKYVKPGGYIGGHDFISQPGDPHDYSEGIQRAIQDFIDGMSFLHGNSKEVLLVQDPNNWSFLIKKDL